MQVFGRKRSGQRISLPSAAARPAPLFALLLRRSARARKSYPLGLRPIGNSCFRPRSARAASRKERPSAPEIDGIDGAAVAVVPPQADVVEAGRAGELEFAGGGGEHHRPGRLDAHESPVAVAAVARAGDV